jgi:hypothetical protein
MHLADPEQLEQVGLTLYERKALMALMLCGVADAATRCREGSVPTSKIYLAMEKLAGLGLVQVQPTRPKMFAALPSEVVVARIVEIVRERSERFASEASALQAMFAGLRSRARGRHPFLDLALGVDGHIRRHLVPLAAARKRILSYLEAGDLMAIDTAIKGGFSILRPSRKGDLRPVNDGSDGRATPRPRHRRGQPFGDGRKGPSALPGVSKEPADERATSLTRRTTCRHSIQ